jgi:dTDP-4-amino-4,6-dideoxygalactose transaminase
VFEELGYPCGMRPVVEAAYAELLSLPLFPRMTDQDRVVETFAAILA